MRTIRSITALTLSGTMKLHPHNHIAASIALLVLATAITTPAKADPAELWIVNPSDVAVTLSVRNANGDYEGATGENVLTIPARGEALRKSGRDSSNSGSVGRARYYFDPSPVGTYSEVQVHGGNGYVFSAQHSNRYPGTWLSKHVTHNTPHLGSNTFILAKAPEKVATTGQWVEFCSVATCLQKKRAVESELERRQQSNISKSDETRTKTEICSKVAGAGATYSAEVNGCMSKEGIHRTDINLEKEMRDNLKVLENETFSLSPKKMSANNVGYAFTWVWNENKGNGWSNQPYVGSKRTGKFTCPEGTAVPTYQPGSAGNDKDNCARVAEF